MRKLIVGLYLTLISTAALAMTTGEKIGMGGALLLGVAGGVAMLSTSKSDDVGLSGIQS